MTVSPAEIVAEYTRDLTAAELQQELLRRAIARTEAAVTRASATFIVLRVKLSRQRDQYRCQARLSTPQLLFPPMILLNQPWSAHDRQLEIDRRRQAVRRAAQLLLYSLGWLALGLLLGMIIAGITSGPLL